MLDLSRLDLEEVATALADQTADEHRWLINPQKTPDRGYAYPSEMCHIRELVLPIPAVPAIAVITTAVGCGPPPSSSRSAVS